MDGFQQGIINREQFTQLYHHLVENENVTQLFRKYSSQASKYVQHLGVGRGRGARMMHTDTHTDTDTDTQSHTAFHFQHLLSSSYLR